MRRTRNLRRQDTVPARPWNVRQRPIGGVRWRAARHAWHPNATCALAPRVRSVLRLPPPRRRAACFGTVRRRRREPSAAGNQATRDGRRAGSPRRFRRPAGRMPACDCGLALPGSLDRSALTFHLPAGPKSPGKPIRAMGADCIRSPSKQVSRSAADDIPAIPRRTRGSPDQIRPDLRGGASLTLFHENDGRLYTYTRPIQLGSSSRNVFTERSGRQPGRPAGRAGRRFDLLEPARMAVQVLAGGAAKRSREALELAVAAVGGLAVSGT